MKPDLLEKYDVQVPRYTSYPTAPHFNEGVDGDAYRGWLGELDGDAPLSLYFHVPFCDTLCWFCGCYTKLAQRYEPVADYLSHLLDEIDLVADALPGRMAARHLHWGGGSPTILTGEDWRRTFERIRARFDIAPGAEAAVELDPRDTKEDYVAALAEAGVNRASIGVQDFDDAVQKAINRIQPFEVTERVVGWLRKYGIDALNLDLMYGLPFQTEAGVRAMAVSALALKPARVALFGYAHVPWMKTHQRLIDEAALPDVRQRLAQFTAAADVLADAGYVRVGLDHFAHPDDSMAKALLGGTLKRNFQGYTSDAGAALIGMGASAIGSLPQGYAQNQQPLRQYKDAVAGGAFPIARGFQLSDEDRARRAVIERLMCDMAVEVDPDAYSFELDSIRPMADDGLVEIDGGAIAITEDGRPFMRLVAAAFDTYLNRSEKRHSKAV